MSIIEEAARRLEQLRRSGIDVSARELGPVTTPNLRNVAARTEARGAAAPAPQGTASRMVELDLPKLISEGFVVPSAPRTRLADEFRVIKRPLLANIHGLSATPVRRANCILLTSALAGEGKTFSAVNLALSLASEVDSRVLLIDCDAVRPQLMERLGLDNESPGLLNMLRQSELALCDVILRTNIPKLSLLPAGRSDSHATELLASEAMRAIVDELATRYQDRILVFDAPPLLAAPETRILASLVGQIVVVVEARKTSQQTVIDAIAQLESCPVVMTILNKATGPGQAAYGQAYEYAGNP